MESAEEKALAKEDKEIMAELHRIKERQEMLDERLDNIDSMVTAVAERIMSRLVTIIVTCPHCGKDIEVALMGNQKPRR